MSPSALQFDFHVWNVLLWIKAMETGIYLSGVQSQMRGGVQ